MRAVYILAVSNVVFTLGYGIYGYIFPNFLATVNANPPQIGLVATLLSASMALTLLPGGVLSDAGHRRTLVIASWLLPVFAPFFFILAELSNSWLYALPGVALFGSSWIGVAAVQSYTSEAAPAGKRGLSFGILVSSGSIGLIASPLIGGLVYDAYGFTTIFFIAFILYLASTAIVLAIPRLPGDLSTKVDASARGADDLSSESNVDTLRTGGSWGDSGKERGPSEGSSVLRRLAPMVALSCLFMGVVYLGWSYIPLYLSEEYGFSFFSVQVMYAVSNLSAVVIVSLLGKLSDKYAPARKLALVTVPIVSLVLGYWILVPNSNSLILPVSFVLLGSVGAVFPLIYSTIGELSAGRRVGRTYGVIGTFVYAAEATTPYLGGTLYAYSRQLPFMLTLALSPLLFVAVYVAYRKTR